MARDSNRPDAPEAGGASFPGSSPSLEAPLAGIERALLRSDGVAAALATARASEERERAQREALYRHFVQAPFPVCVLRGPSHVIELASPPMLRAWGVTDDAVGRSLLEALPHLRDQPFVGHLDGVLRTGVPHEGRAERARLPAGANGKLEEVYFDSVCAPLRDGNGEIEGVLISAFVVTDAVLARREIERARDAAEATIETQRAARELQERFVAVLGHDLRGPLAAIALGAQVLEQEAADPTISRVATRIRSSARRMARMVEQIIDLSRARVGGGLPVRPAPMDLFAMLTNVVDEVRTAHPERAIELHGASLLGTWDIHRLEQVFANLVGNAVHHGVPTSPVVVTARAMDGDRVGVDVHNRGAPIPEAIRASLFDPFRRGGDDDRRSKSAGLGLGLFLSREIVVAHGGEIEVRSSAAEGTTFRVTLRATA